MIHSYALNRSLLTTWPSWLPKRAAAISPTAVPGDGEDRGQPGHRHPQPRLATVLAPRRLVDIHRVRLMDRDRQFVVRGFQNRGTLSFQLGDHPGGDRQSQQVGGYLLDLPLTQAVGPREHGQHGLQVRTEAPVGTPGGKTPQVVSPQSGQARRWSRYSSTIGSILGNSAT